MTGFWVALRFLTIFPTPRKERDDDEVASLSLVYFPLVGLLLGAMLLGIYYALMLVLPSPVVFALIVIALAVVTGGHHLDGLMDSLDGVFGGQSKEEKLAIMRDSKVGAFGVAGVILLLLLKYVSLTSAPLLPALLLMPTLGRWAMLNAIFFFPYARPDGMGLPFKRGANWQRLTIATILPVVAALAILRWKGLVLLVVLWLIVFGIARFVQHRLGGLTGDNYGAINEIAEVATLILIVLISRF
jgi:adenosylcobinamide-GDP ribazoletransferase